MSLLDRLLIRNYLKAYLVCLVSLLSLYIVVDLFTNIEDFVGHGKGLMNVVKHIAFYYGYKVTQIFDQLCEVIVLLAAMFTVAWMQRHNELLPLLSAGVSTRRVVRPVLLAACVVLGLGVLNQELLIPRFGTFLSYERDDPNGEKEVIAHGAWEPNEIYLHAYGGFRPTRAVRPFHALIPENIAGTMVMLTAEEGYYIPPGDGPRTGGWLLVRAKHADLKDVDIWGRGLLERIDPGKYFLRTTEVTFETLTRARAWYRLASTPQLQEELNKSDSARLSSMAVLFHMRLTRPILGMLLLFMGLSVILRDQNRNIFISTGLCLVLCGVFFAALFTCKSLGENDFLSPALAAWLPVLCFGPLAFVLFDAVHT
jgi:lipopolysaccharide export system permease protein